MLPLRSRMTGALDVAPSSPSRNVWSTWNLAASATAGMSKPAPQRARPNVSDAILACMMISSARWIQNTDEIEPRIFRRSVALCHGDTPERLQDSPNAPHHSAARQYGFRQPRVYGFGPPMPVRVSAARVA